MLPLMRAQPALAAICMRHFCCMLYACCMHAIYALLKKTPQCRDFLSSYAVLQINSLFGIVVLAIVNERAAA